jgi:hypothetical protein
MALIGMGQRRGNFKHRCQPGIVDTSGSTAVTTPVTARVSRSSIAPDLGPLAAHKGTRM